MCPSDYTIPGLSLPAEYLAEPYACVERLNISSKEFFPLLIDGQFKKKNVVCQEAFPKSLFQTGASNFLSAMAFKTWDILVFDSKGHLFCLSCTLITDNNKIVKCVIWNIRFNENLCLSEGHGK